ncbi:MAG UNVERIFIED_CONTAM: hypothetical protein LVR29_11460 [Microcystis novacekii LVE1205-3]
MTRWRKRSSEFGWDYLAKTEHLHSDWQLLHEYPCPPDLLAMSCVWESLTGELTVAAKGAPEAIADLCHFSRIQQQELAEQIPGNGQRGLRVLGVAQGRKIGTLPKTHALRVIRASSLLGI